MVAAPAQLFPGKQFISTVLDLLETKTTMVGGIARIYLQRAAMAGLIAGVMYATNFGLVAAFDAIPASDGQTWRELGRFLGAIAFGWALVFIYYTKSELLTSNMMIVSIGAYHRRIGWWRATRLLTLCFTGNLLGGVLVAALLRMTSVLDGAAEHEMAAAVEHKLAYLTQGWTGFGDLLGRAILCNFLINLGMLLVYNGVIKDDLTKSLAMIMSVFIFAFLGLEHSVANSVLFLIVGFRDGLDVIAAVGNVAVVLVGNFIGGGLLIGLYYAYANDDRPFLRRQPGGPEDVSSRAAGPLPGQWPGTDETKGTDG